jgi:hypothetical protein
MFAYKDPTGSSFTGTKVGLQEYRMIVHQLYVQFARLPNSTFTLLEAFSELSRGSDPTVATVSWIAFPRSVSATFQEIDDDRFQFQDEYVEWRIERATGGKIKRVTFTTEFPEYYQALARVSAAALIKGIQRAIPDANPTNRDLFGSNFNPDAATPDARAGRFLAHAPQNLWNNGKKGILFLFQQFNTMHALFNLVGQCAIPKPSLIANQVCANVGGACGPTRNSDPVVCESAQNLARSNNGLSLKDPPGIRILRLQGIWKINGQAVDINNTAQNQGAWTISRNGHRAVLDVSKNVTIGDDPISTGTDVAAKLQVGADVISAPETALPAWAKTGQESSRQIV